MRLDLEQGSSLIAYGLELGTRAHPEVDLLTWKQGTSRKGIVMPADGSRKTIRISPDAGQLPIKESQTVHY